MHALDGRAAILPVESRLRGAAVQPARDSFEFLLFALTLLGVALFHQRTLPVAATGLAGITGGGRLSIRPGAADRQAVPYPRTARTRECLAIDIGHGLTGRDVVATLERLRFERGLPQRIYCDNGTEFVSAAMELWAYTNGVILDFSRRGKPTDNAAIESFNGRFREECLNIHWFASMDDAQQKIDAFRWDYNANHPHRALKGLSPNEYARMTMEPAAESL